MLLVKILVITLMELIINNSRDNKDCPSATIVGIIRLLGAWYSNMERSPVSFGETIEPQ